MISKLLKKCNVPKNIVVIERLCQYQLQVVNYRAGIVCF